uniref:Uncharacterized protein n=1 Tax=Vespula pensylvanica TaxID=30213 RepID=A0A834N169_VESPE|nr:hypothetical protein H0235_017585 [Vespula pensylvanica]
MDAARGSKWNICSNEGLSLHTISQKVIYAIIIFISIPWVRLGTIRKILWRRNNNDSEKENLGIKAEDEEEAKGSTGDEEVEGDGKYNDSHQTDVGLWPNIDFVKLDLNSKVPNTAYRKAEVERIIETFRE